MKQHFKNTNNVALLTNKSNKNNFHIKLNMHLQHAQDTLSITQGRVCTSTHTIYDSYLHAICNKHTPLVMLCHAKKPMTNVCVSKMFCG